MLLGFKPELHKGKRQKARRQHLPIAHCPLPIAYCLLLVLWLNQQKQVGLANDKKAALQIGRLHRQIDNIRKDTLHKITTHVNKNQAVIETEDLNVSGMMANGKLTKADMSFDKFRHQMEYKTQLYGSKLGLLCRHFQVSCPSIA